MILMTIRIILAMMDTLRGKNDERSIEESLRRRRTHEYSIVLGLFFVLIILKVPVAFALVLSSIISCFILQLAPLSTVAAAAMNSLFSYPLLAIAFYIFAGSVMTRGGISRKLCKWIDTMFGRFTGGQGMVTIVTSAFFAALSGSASATCASIGSMMVPEMEAPGLPQAPGPGYCGGGRRHRTRNSSQ